jgi:hypothetical protein
MTATARVLPDGSVSVTDGDMSYAPLSPEAVQAIAQAAAVSANAHNTQAMTELLGQLAMLITAAGAVAGDTAYAQVTVTPGKASAVLDAVSFALVQQNLNGAPDPDGNWVSGPLTVSPKPADPPPAPVPTPAPPPPTQ